MAKKKIYICFTYHHVLISVVKALINGDKPDIVLAENIIGRDDLCKRLLKSDLFSAIYLNDNKYLVFYPKSKYQRYYWCRYQKKLVDKKSILPKAVFNKEIYIYNDWTYPAIYLKSAHLRYHIIEDSVDYYKNLPEDYLQNVYKHLSLKERLRNIIFPDNRDNLRLHDTYKKIIDIEVNNANGVCLKRKKLLKVVEKRQLFNKLDKACFNLLLEIFGNLSLNELSSDANVLILGSSAGIEGIVPYDVIIKTYEAIVNKMSTSYHIYLKPHPRDTFDYNIEGLKTINPLFPSEIVYYGLDNEFKGYIAIATTAVSLFDKNKVAYFDSFDSFNIEKIHL